MHHTMLPFQQTPTMLQQQVLRENNGTDIRVDMCCHVAIANNHRSAMRATLLLPGNN